MSAVENTVHTDFFFALAGLRDVVGDCILMSVSIVTPKAFSIRSDMMPDRSALQLSKLDREGA